MTRIRSVRMSIRRSIRGRKAPLATLAVAGLLGILSGLALADEPGESPDPCGTGFATRVNEPTSGQTSTVTMGGATLTFKFDNLPGGPFSAIWNSDVPFFGTIMVKSGSGANESYTT